MFVLPLALLVACSDVDNATPPSPQIDDEQVVTDLDVATDSPQTEEEPSGIQSETLLENAPALPTNGSPCKSSFSPGPSPTNNISAFSLPTPKTRFVLVSPKGQLLQFEQSAFNCSKFSYFKEQSTPWVCL